MSTLSTRSTAGSRSTVKLRSMPVIGSASPKGLASKAGSQKLQPRARAVPEATMAAVRVIRSTIRGQRSSSSSRVTAKPATRLRGSSPSTGKLLSARPLKGSSIRPSAWISR